MGLILPDMRHRTDIPELMDDPHSDAAKLIRTVKQFRAINLLFSRSRKLLKNYVFPKMSPDREEPYRFLDVGAGGCDIALWLRRYCLQRGIAVEITCLDYDHRIADYAEEITRDIPQVHVVRKSVFELDETESFDFSFSNHFLHHFPNDQVAQILRKLDIITKGPVLMNDLNRSIAAYSAYRLFSFIFLHNSFSAYDGAVSIRRGFTQDEMRDIVLKAGLSERARIIKIFPGRIFVLSSHQEKERGGIV